MDAFNSTTKIWYIAAFKTIENIDINFHHKFTTSIVARTELFEK